MQQQSFKYRNQLITIFHCLQETADSMYAHAFNLALDTILWKNRMIDYEEAEGQG